MSFFLVFGLDWSWVPEDETNPFDELGEIDLTFLNNFESYDFVACRDSMSYPLKVSFFAVLDVCNWGASLVKQTQAVDEWFTNSHLNFPNLASLRDLDSFAIEITFELAETRRLESACENQLQTGEPSKIVMPTSASYLHQLETLSSTIL